MTTYYLAPDGSDRNDGTEQAPWHTITHAADRASSGDTLVVQDGTYEYGSDVQIISTSNLTVRAADGSSPTMVWSGNAYGWENRITEGLRISKADGVTVDGLELRDSHSGGIQIERSADCTLKNLNVHHNGALGVFAAFGFSGAHLSNVDSHHNGASSTATVADGFVLNGASGDSTGTLVEECRSWENLEDGFDCWDGDGITFRRCQAFDNGRPNSETPESTAMGIGFKLGGGDHGGNNTAERCLAWGNHYAGFADNIPADGCVAHNCTAWDNKRNFAFTHPGSELINNVGYDARNSNVQVEGDVAQEANSWNLGISNPRFRSLEPSSSDFLRLASDSPCINAGVDVGLSYHGEAPDLGAIEETTSNETGSSALYYHDGTEWQEVSMKYHDGEQFVS